MAQPIRTHRDLAVYHTAIEAALFACSLTRRFPADEFTLKDQTRRSARAPGACIPEAFRKRGYPNYWKNKLSDAQAEAAEAQYWLDIACREGYCTEEEFLKGFDLFEKVISQLAKMIVNPAPWTANRASRP